MPPLPAEPSVIWPGRALASATSSFRFFAGMDGCTTSMVEVVMTGVSGWKSRSVSYGSFE